MGVSIHVIRTYEERDAAQVWDLHLQGIQETSARHAEPDWDADVRDVPNIYLRPRSHFWVMEADDGTLAAMIAVKHVDDETAEIKRLRVRRDIRRSGLAQRLVDVAESFCRDEGYAKIVLDTTTLQEPAIKLWEKNGYVRTGERDMREVGGFTLLFFEKVLR